MFETICQISIQSASPHLVQTSSVHLSLLSHHIIKPLYELLGQRQDNHIAYANSSLP